MEPRCIQADRLSGSSSSSDHGPAAIRIGTIEKVEASEQEQLDNRERVVIDSLEWDERPGSMVEFFTEALPLINPVAFIALTP